MQPELELFVRVKVASRALSVSEWTLREHLKAGRVPHIRFGRAILIPKSWLEQKIKESLAKAAA